MDICILLFAVLVILHPRYCLIGIYFQGLMYQQQGPLGIAIENFSCVIHVLLPKSRVTQLTQDDLNVLRRFVSKFNISVAFFSPQIALIFFLCFITSKYDSKQNLNSSDTLPPSLPHQSAASLFLLRLYSLPTN